MYNFIQRISDLQEFQFILEACAGGQVIQESISKTSNLQTTILQNAEEWSLIKKLIRWWSLNKPLFAECMVHLCK